MTMTSPGSREQAEEGPDVAEGQGEGLWAGTSRGGPESQQLALPSSTPGPPHHLFSPSPGTGRGCKTWLGPKSTRPLPRN